MTIKVTRRQRTHARPSLGETPRPFSSRIFASGDADIVDAVTRADAYRSEMLSIFDGVDGFICPANAQPAMCHASADAGDIRPFSCTISYNPTGWPGAVVSGGSSIEGLPIGIQIVAPPWREGIALALAALLEYEWAVSWRRPILSFCPAQCHPDHG